MVDQEQPKIDVPSKGVLAKATGIALLVALLLLFVAVLPAEYGFDPLKTGAAFGLTGISQAQVKEVKGATPTPAPGLASTGSRGDDAASHLGSAIGRGTAPASAPAAASMWRYTGIPASRAASVGPPAGCIVCRNTGTPLDSTVAAIPRPTAASRSA